MSFFSVYPRSKQFKGSDLEAFPLRVVRDEGVEYEPAIKFKEIELAGGASLFRNNSRFNDSFSITVLLHVNDRVEVTTSGEAMGVMSDIGSAISMGSPMGDVSNTSTVSVITSRSTVPVMELLDYCIRNAEPFYVVTDAVGIPSDELWLVTEQKKRKQEYNTGYVLWELTFTKYKEVTIGKFNKTTDVITKALEKLNKSSNTSKNTSSKTTLKDKMKKCKYTVLVFSKTKKTNNCVKVMQEILWNAGCFAKNVKKSEAIDGWYGKTTREAVKNYKKKNKLNYGLDTWGNQVGYKCWQVMCGTAKKVQKITEAGTSNKQIIKNATSTDKNKGSIVNVNVSGSNLNNATVTVRSTSVQSQSSGKK